MKPAYRGQDDDENAEHHEDNIKILQCFVASGQRLVLKAEWNDGGKNT